MKKLVIAIVVLLLVLSGIYLANILSYPQIPYSSPGEYYGRYVIRMQITSDNETNVIAQTESPKGALFIIYYKNLYTNLGGHDFSARAFKASYNADEQELYEFTPYAFKIERDANYLYLVPLTPLEKLYLLTVADQAVYDEDLMSFWDKVKALATLGIPDWVKEAYA